MGNINNNLKQLKQFKSLIPLYLGFYNKSDTDHRYNTNYDIVDKKGNILTCLRRQACFATVFTPGYDHKKLGFKFGVGRKLRVYALSQDTILTESEIRKYMAYFKALQLPYTIKVLDNYDLNSCNISNKLDISYTSVDKISQEEEAFKNIPEDLIEVFEKNKCKYYNKYQSSFDNNSKLTKAKYLNCFNRQKVYMMELDLDKYTHINDVKVMCYLFRYIYEFDHDKLVKDLIKLKTDNPKTSILELFSKLHKAPNTYYLGHTFMNKYSSSVFPITFKMIKELLNSERNIEYNNTALDKIKKLGKFVVLFYKNSYWCHSEKYYVTPVLNKDESIKSYIKRIFKDVDKTIEDLKIRYFDKDKPYKLLIGSAIEIEEEYIEWKNKNK